MFHTVRENEFAIQTFEFEGLPDVVSIESMTFVDLGDGRTRLEGHAVYPTLEARDGMVSSGMESGHVVGLRQARGAALLDEGGLSHMDWTLEVVILPVSDIARSIEFYRDQVGFHLDHDTQNEFMHVTQLTPTGSGCSIVFGDLPPHKAMAPGSLKSLQLVVADAEAARAELVGRGVECEPVQVIAPGDGGTFFGFADPDGNTWAVQEIKARGEKPLIPHDHRGRFGEGADV